MPSSVVIVGGSLSGLMHGVQLKREGVNVTILEQDSASERSSHNAGIHIDEHVNKLLHQHDRTGLQISLQSNVNCFSIRRRPKVFKADKGPTRYMTNWGYIYRILRANFDGYASKACPSPPTPDPGDGQARYLTGMHVTSLQYDDGLVTLHYVDGKTGKEQSISSELVLGADGLHSTIRKLVQAPLEAPKTYSGFVAWRGAVPRRSVSQETAEFFSGQVSLDFLGKMYMICYVIPTEDGNFDPESQLLNWVLYKDLAEGSPDEAAVLTDVHGRRRQQTVPQGLVDPAVWARLREDLVQRAAPPFAELAAATADPFVTKVSDVLGSRASFCGGRVVLVGDALATYRPHAGKATENAAGHCLELARVRRGETEMAGWDREACAGAKHMYLWSRVIGEMGRGTWFSFLKSIAMYSVFVIRRRLQGPRL